MVRSRKVRVLIIWYRNFYILIIRYDYGGDVGP